jgi:hypothetical protein
MTRIRHTKYDIKKIGNLIMQRMIGVGMAQLIKEPTHHGIHQSSLIDLMFVNVPDKMANIKNLKTGGDHDLIQSTRRSKCRRRKVLITKRSWMIADASKLRWDMFNKVKTGTG